MEYKEGNTKKNISKEIKIREYIKANSNKEVIKTRNTPDPVDVGNRESRTRYLDLHRYWNQNNQRIQKQSINIPDQQRFRMWRF
jgi:hypothetical protein